MRDLNPFFLFEIRQVVRNRMILAALCVYLAISTGWFGYQLFEAALADRLNGYDKTLGAELASGILGILYYFSLGVILLYSTATTIGEGFYQEELFHTPLPPLDMGRGKIYASFLICSLFYSASLPILVFAWMLRGVDIVALGTGLISLFLLTQTLNVYVMAIFFRVRDVNHVMAAVAGLVFASPPLLIVWGISHAYTRNFFLFSNNFFGSLAGVLISLFWTVSIAAMVFLSCTELFRLNAETRSVSRRLGTAALFSWLAAFLVMIVGFAIFLPGFAIVWAIYQIVTQYWR